MRSTSALEEKNYRILLYFILGWVVINFLQAQLTGLDGDEAYYWMFSRQLQWGYFDHPPMVALSIKIGELFGHGSFFTRLGTVLFSAGAIYFGYKALPENLRNARFYVLTFASIVVFNMYGFIVTPDASLFFFTALFFYAYRLFLGKENISNILLLSLSITGLLYSKYHGVLPVFFTFLSNPRLALRPAAWLVIGIALIAMLPHFVWQYQHDWPTVRYHLFERIGSRYRIDKTSNYIIGQLLIWGPFTTIPALYLIVKRRMKDVYLRAHYFTLFGVFIFFLLSSFRSTIEPHWTLTAGISFMVLFQQVLLQANDRTRKVFSVLLLVNIAVIVLARLLFVIQGTPLEKIKGFNSVFFGRKLSDSLYKYAEGKPLVFVNSYTQPSLYKYYHRSEDVTAYNTIPERRNYFNLSDDEEKLNNRDVLIATGYQFGKYERSITGFSDSMYLYKLDSFKAVNALKLLWTNKIDKARMGEIFEVRLNLVNSSNYTVSSSNKLFINYTFIKTRKEFETSKTLLPITDNDLIPGYNKPISLRLVMPGSSGKYRLIFSIVQAPFAGTFASPIYNVEVE
jgi:hypothetical protein